jgi:hypothetical protein
MDLRIITHAMLFLVWTVHVIAAPIPKELNSPIFFPTTVGAKWVYLGEDGREEGIEVSSVEKEGGGWIVSRTGLRGNAVVYTKVAVSHAGLKKDAVDSEGKTVEDWIIKGKGRSGDSWDTPEGGKRKVHDPEVVVVPAGKFTAVRVETELVGVTTTSWYAAGVGEVKRVVRREGAKEIVTRSLKTFEAK